MKARTRSRNTEPQIKPEGRSAFNTQAFLDSVGTARRIVTFHKSEKIYSQGDRSSHVLYIQGGRVKLSVVNQAGKEGVVALLGPGDFFGEGGIAGQHVRMSMATAITPATVVVIEEEEMIRLLHTEHKFSDRFISYLLSRNFRSEGDLVDQHFNSSEKRLARALLLLANYRSDDPPKKIIPQLTQ